MSNTDLPGFAELDRDGAIEEAASKVDGHTRQAFLRRTGAFMGAGAAFAALPAGAFAQGGASKGDVAILNFALTLEYLESAFYAEALSKGALKGETKKFADVVAAHEKTHVTTLKSVLGSSAVKEPQFNFKGTTASQSTFQQTSIVLEDTGVKAYLGQAGNIKAKAVLKSAASILAIEARHASWIRNIVGNGSSPSPAPESFQSSLTMSAVLAAVQGTGFITSMPSASAGGATSGNPSVTG